MATTPRKRPRSISSSPHLPPDVINPLSRTQRQLTQFAVAGLTDRDPDPAALDPLFPHRGLRRPGPLLSSSSATALSEGNDGPDDEEEYDGHEAEDGDGGDDGGKGPSVKERKSRTPGKSEAEQHVRTLLESIYHFLDTGHVARAARAYALILRLQPDGRPIDVRRHHLWAIGAEILMREGEGPPPGGGGEGDRDEDDDDRDRDSEHALTRTLGKERWGSAANMAKVRAYLETLIQQHPYDHRRSKALSAVDFHLALFRCEVYNADAEYRIARQRSLYGNYTQNHGASGVGVGVDVDVAMDSDDDALDTSISEEDGGAAVRDRLRREAFLAARDIAYRMSRLMQDRPYSTHPQYQQLLATVKAYIADLEASTDNPRW